MEISERRKLRRFSDGKKFSCFCRFAGVDDRNSLMKLFIFTNFHLYANWSKFSILTRKLVARFLAILIYYKFAAPSLVGTAAQRIERQTRQTISA